MSASAPARGLRIGELAKRAGTTPRTIRYYEELGLLPEARSRDAGQHRLYGESDVERVLQLLRLKDLLGLSLDELRDVIEAEEARGALRAEWHEGSPSRDRRREIIEEAQAHIAASWSCCAGAASGSTSWSGSSRRVARRCASGYASLTPADGHLADRRVRHDAPASCYPRRPTG